MSLTAQSLNDLIQALVAQIPVGQRRLDQSHADAVAALAKKLGYDDARELLRWINEHRDQPAIQALDACLAPSICIDRTEIVVELQRSTRSGIGAGVGIGLRYIPIGISTTRGMSSSLSRGTKISITVEQIQLSRTPNSEVQGEDNDHHH